MPYFYCTNTACNYYLRPEKYISALTQTACRHCGKPANVTVSADGHQAAQDLRARKYGDLVQRRLEPVIWQNPQLPYLPNNTEFYCQNQVQSGDTTGVGMALVLYPDRHLMFLVNQDRLERAKGYLFFYSMLGIPKERIHVSVCEGQGDLDEDPDPKPDVSIEEQAQQLVACADEYRRLHHEFVGVDGDLRKLGEFDQKTRGQGFIKTKPDSELRIHLRLSDEQRVELEQQSIGKARTALYAALAERLSRILTRREDVRKFSDECAKAPTILADCAGSIIPWDYHVPIPSNRVYNEIVNDYNRMAERDRSRQTEKFKKELMEFEPKIDEYRKQVKAAFGQLDRTAGEIRVEDERRILIKHQYATLEFQRALAIFEREKALENGLKGLKYVFELKPPSLERRKAELETCAEAIKNLPSGGQLWNDALNRIDAMLNGLSIATNLDPVLEEARIEVRARPKPAPDLPDPDKIVVTMSVAGIRNAFQTIYPTHIHKYAEIGKTTRDVIEYLRGRGLAATIRALSRPFNTKKWSAAIPDPRAQVLEFSRQRIPELLKNRRTQKRPMLVFIWIRGMNSDERKSVLDSNITSDFVCDGNKGQIDAAKRNPHHLMTAQLYETIVSLLNSLSISNGMVHEFVPIPIGDPVVYDEFTFEFNAQKKRYLPTAEMIHVGPAETNLIEYWDGKAFLATRFAQMYFLYLLLHAKNFDCVQMGVRSGATEQGMYLGMPTIYIEEQYSPSGARMASVTRMGKVPSSTQDALVKAKEFSDANGDQAMISVVDCFRVAIDQFKDPSDAQFNFDVATFTPSAGKLRENFKNKRPDYESKAKAALDRVKEAYNNAWNLLPEGAMNIATTEDFSQRADYPFFLRLVTKNFVGLNQARSRINLQNFMQAWTLANGLTSPDQELQRLALGTLTSTEFATLGAQLSEISFKYPAYRESVFSE